MNGFICTIKDGASQAVNVCLCETGNENRLCGKGGSMPMCVCQFISVYIKKSKTSQTGAESKA